MTFDEIRVHMPDDGNKADERISQALEALPVRIALLMTPKEAAGYVGAFHRYGTDIYRSCTRDR